jgi:hypothetical protein
MERVNLGSVIEQSISRFSQNRIGDKPPLFVMISPALPAVPWHDRSLKEFVRMFLYEVLLTNDPDAIIEVTLRRKMELKDLNVFVGISPSYWMQLRVAGRGLKIMEPLIEELFAEVGYYSEKWVGVQDSAARMGIFGSKKTLELKMIFCLELSRNILKCDVLLPVFANVPPTYVAIAEVKQQRRELN